MAKPIFLMKVGKHLQAGPINAIQEKLQNRMPDYHILVIQCGYNDEPQFECFNVSDVDEINFETFKQQVTSLLKSE